MGKTQISDTLPILIIVFLSTVGLSHQTVYSCNASASCGCSMNPAVVTRIVGGEAANSSTWGWAVSISIAGRYLCGGSIISDSWVITAAHCVSDHISSQITVYAGSTRRWVGTQVRVVRNTIMHPNYDSTTFVNDIALLQLQFPFNMSDPSLSLVCLPSVNETTLSMGEWPPAGTTVVAIGWGRLAEGGSLPTTLQQVTVETVDYRASTCTVVINNYHVQLCAGVSGGGKDTCQGDSGGPLTMFSSNNQWMLVGLTSSGIGCARPNSSGVYTRVAAYEDWINSNMNGETSNASSTISTISSSMPRTSMMTTIRPPLSHASVMSIYTFKIFAFVFILWLIRPFY